MCEDYRAGATIDRQLDEADLAAGRKIACPTFVLWARSYLPGDPLEVWRSWCTNVTGASVDSGHFLAEENPQDTLAALVPFLKSMGSVDMSIVVPAGAAHAGRILAGVGRERGIQDTHTPRSHPLLVPDTAPRTIPGVTRERSSPMTPPGQSPAAAQAYRFPPRGPRSRWRWAGAVRAGLRTS